MENQDSVSADQKQYEKARAEWAAAREAIRNAAKGLKEARRKERVARKVFEQADVASQT
jgi:hypothetical protein